MNPEAITLRIRELLEKLCKSREIAYKHVIEQGKPVPNYADKVKAIEKIRLHLEHFTTASPIAHIRLVVALRADILEILPDSKRFKTFRDRCERMLTWCDQHQNLTTI